MLPTRSIRAASATGLCLIASLGVAATSSADAPAGTDTCSAGALSQPFSPFKDDKWYSLAPAGDFPDPAAVEAAGWQLSGGAAIVATDGADGADDYVLDMPSGATAISPTTCVTADYPTARMWVRDVVGDEGVGFAVSYVGQKTWNKPKDTGRVRGEKNRGWKPSSPLNIQPDSHPGWQQTRFVLTAGGTKSRFQVDDFWIDPKMR